MLVSGVWRLWLTPRRKSSLAASSSSSWLVLGLDRGEQLGVPDRDRHLAGEQLEQVLVGALPEPGRRQLADEHAEVLARPRAAPPGAGATRPGRRSSLGIDRAGRP